MQDQNEANGQLDRNYKIVRVVDGNGTALMPLFLAEVGAKDEGPGLSGGSARQVSIDLKVESVAPSVMEQFTALMTQEGADMSTDIDNDVTLGLLTFTIE